jgi:hypothetical protein
MSTIDFTGQGVPELPPFSTAPRSVSRLNIGGHRNRLASAAQGLVDQGSSAASSAVGSASSAASSAIGQGSDAVQNVVGQGAQAASNAIDSASSTASSAIDQVSQAVGAPGQPEQDPEEIYELVVDRLKRDLIAELEQNGHLLRETL